MYIHVSETKVLQGNIYLYHVGYSESHIFNFLLFLPLHVGCDSPNAIHDSVMNQYPSCLATQIISSEFTAHPLDFINCSSNI